MNKSLYSLCNSLYCFTLVRTNAAMWLGGVLADTHLSPAAPGRLPFDLVRHHLTRNCTDVKTDRRHKKCIECEYLAIAALLKRASRSTSRGRVSLGYSLWVPSLQKQEKLWTMVHQPKAPFSQLVYTGLNSHRLLCAALLGRHVLLHLFLSSMHDFSFYFYFCSWRCSQRKLDSAASIWYL